MSSESAYDRRLVYMSTSTQEQLVVLQEVLLSENQTEVRSAYCCKQWKDGIGHR